MTFFTYLKFLFSRNVDPMELWDNREKAGSPRMCRCFCLGVIAEADMVMGMGRTFKAVDRMFMESTGETEFSPQGWI
jgi:hypothetical protein